MANQIGNTMKHLRNAFSGNKYLAAKNVALEISPAAAVSTPKQEIHVSARQEYPAAEPLPLPVNIDPTESTRFSPQRARDISSTAIATNIWNRVDITMDATNDHQTDPHVGSYDCTGAVSLNSSMQSNVPSPFGGMHKFTHLNMPGGQWEQSSKWMSHDLNASHYMMLRHEARKNWSTGTGVQASNENDKTAKGSSSKMHGPLTAIASSKLFANNCDASQMQRRFYAKSLCDRMRATTNHNLLVTKRHLSAKEPGPSAATDSSDRSADSHTDSVPLTDTTTLLSPKDKLKKAVKDYGTTVFIFHVAISLTSLGFFYQIVASGLDVVAVLNYLGLESISSSISSNIATGASTFVIAYAIHKVFAPVRISITLFSAPFIVRFLRNRGILKTKSPSN